MVQSPLLGYLDQHRNLLYLITLCAQDLTPQLLKTLAEPGFGAGSGEPMLTVPSGGLSSSSAANPHPSEGHPPHRHQHLFSTPILCHPTATGDAGDGSSSFPTTKARKSILQTC